MNVTLDEKTSRKLELMKAYYGVRSNVSVIALLLHDKSDSIREECVKRLFVPAKQFEILKAEADRLGLNVNDYTNMLVAEEIEKRILQDLKP